ncbi:M15 family metallopeptidase [Flexivirga meconopsidis]|uniref:M15 family metallopeptidase n=1 Tax=Flexivirga meconopsidis TaxID=2977121 RepID=UPI00223F7D57|nr:M15 family metallopeptidase [Flexivirga meconopsidis]
MSYEKKLRTPGHHLLATTVFALVVAALLVIAALLAVADRQSVRGSGPLPSLLTSYGKAQQSDGGGELPRGVTVFDDDYPAVSNLEPNLLSALRAAATDAKAHGVTFQVNSGWRSTTYQKKLFADAVDKYGSTAEAAKWVAPATSSSHVSGRAVDIGPTDADSWLSQHGSAYGLCQVYANEPWHYELRPTAVVRGCPTAYADATQDPRLHQ